MPDPLISYAQNGEDVVLWRALGDVPDAFFIDVGAADPVGYSATYAMYQRGWRGINIEPVVEFVDALRSLRPRDLTLAIAVGASSGTATLFTPEGTGLSTLDEVAADRLRNNGFELVECEVEVRTLTAVCDEYCDEGQDIHLLKVDVEGFEHAVLRGLDLERWRPWVIVVEATEPMSQTLSYESWEDVLTSHGYECTLFDGLNRYYLATEHADLAPRLDHGPCVFDEPYQRADVTLAIDRHRGQLMQELDTSRAQNSELERTATVLEAELERLRGEHSVERAALGEALASNAELRRTVDELRAELDVLADQRREADHRNARVVGSLTSRVDDLTRSLAAAESDHVKTLQDHVDNVTTHEAVRLSLVDSIRHADARMRQLEAELGAERATVSDLESTIADLHSAIRGIYGSNTWRIGRIASRAGATLRLGGVVQRPVTSVLDRAFGRTEDLTEESVEPTAEGDEELAASSPHLEAADDPVAPADEVAPIDDRPAGEVAVLVPRLDRIVAASSWAFPVHRRWGGPLERIADLFSGSGMPSNDDLRREVEALRIDSDEVLRDGRYTAAERSAIYDMSLAVLGRSSSSATRDAMTVDARCLSDGSLSSRGVGRHARAVLGDVRSSENRSISLLLDRATDAGSIGIDHGVGFEFGTVDPVVSRIDLPSTFLSLSPATASPLPQWIARDTYAIAVLYDLIPLGFPRHYFGSAAEMLQYAARLVWLRSFDEIWAISTSTADQAAWLLSIPRDRFHVTGVESEIGRRGSIASASVAAERVDSAQVDLKIVLCGGGDTRKNLLAPVVGLRTLPFISLDVVVVGALPTSMSDDLSEQFERRENADISFLGPVSDEAVTDAYLGADLVVVPSHAEGYSLPVAEAVVAGRPVLASRIPAHVELLGDGPWLVDPADPDGWAQGVLRFRSSGETWSADQLSHFDRVRSERWAVRVPSSHPPVAATPTRSRRPSLAIVSPFPPQQSGIADYSAHTLVPLTDHFDVSIVVTDTHDVAAGQFAPVHGRTVETSVRSDVDFVLHVLGNSHFHIPALEHLERFGGAALAHDNRMADIYSFWRGDADTARIMSMGPADVSPDEVSGARVSLDEIPDLAFGEIAGRARPFFVHSEPLARRIAAETGVRPITLPFCPYRLPDDDFDRSALDARRGRPRIASFGEVSATFKRHDLMVEALAWLRDWGVDVELVFVGAASGAEAALVRAQSEELGVADRVTITGRLSDERYREHLVDADVCIQVRSSPLLTLSGAVVDAIAYGLPLVTTEAIVEVVDSAPSLFPVSDHFSSFELAQAVRTAIDTPVTREDDERRREFIAARSPKAYSEQLAAAILDSDA